MSSRRFLERWSRLKKAAETAAATEPVDAESLLADLTPDSDFGQFLREEISEEIRRKAMKTLFADPHFNVMDGLDVYIEDFNLSEPIPDAMMMTLNHARGLLYDAPEDQGGAAGTEERCDILAADGQNVPGPEALPPATSENQ